MLVHPILAKCCKMGHGLRFQLSPFLRTFSVLVGQAFAVVMSGIGSQTKWCEKK
jgi:hypothetical protein